MTREAARVLDGLGLHMLLLGVGRLVVTHVTPPRIEAELELHPDQRVSDAVAAACLAIDDQQLDALTFDRRDRWGELQHVVRVGYVHEGTLWEIVFRMTASTGLQKR
jgi:hypothetical protein